MAEGDDKYPESSARRRFVKGVVGSAALAGVGTASAGIVNSATQPTGKGGGQTTYYGVENIAGPAPRAMPQIPIKIDSEGYLKGVYPTVTQKTEQGKTFTTAEMQLGGITYSVDWFQYCGVQGYKAIDPTLETDNYFRYAPSPPPKYAWQNENVSPGDKVHVDDFADFKTWGNGIGKGKLGKPAACTWRSESPQVQTTLPVEIIRSDLVGKAIQEAEGDVKTWLQASTAENFVVHLDKCTHFCCVPRFKATEQSAEFDAENEIYCPCHQSVYDPFSIVKRSFVAYPRPEEQ